MFTTHLLRKASKLFPAQAVFIGVALAAAKPAWSVDLLTRVPGSWYFGPNAMWTAASTTNHRFFPLSPPMKSSQMLGARFSYQLTNDSGDCKLRAAIRYSNDGVAWDTAEEVMATYADTDNEIVYGTSYINLLSVPNTTPRAWIQFGIETVNRSGSQIAFCQGTLRVEPQE